MYATGYTVPYCNLLHTLYHYIEVLVYWRYIIYCTIFSQCLKNFWLGPSSTKPFNRYQELSSQWVKPLGHEIDHLSSRAEAKNEWSNASVPPTHLHDVLLPHTPRSFMTKWHTANGWRLFTRPRHIQVLSNLWRATVPWLGRPSAWPPLACFRPAQSPFVLSEIPHTNSDGHIRTSDLPFASESVISLPLSTVLYYAKFCHISRVSTTISLAVNMTATRVHHDREAGILRGIPQIP